MTTETDGVTELDVAIELDVATELDGATVIDVTAVLGDDVMSVIVLGDDEDVDIVMLKPHVIGL